MELRYALFANYQKNVHKEPPSKASASQFKSWLCYGLDRSIYDQDGKPRKIGSYHQCYRLDGRLVAMGVLDIMPDCVSSVYLMSVLHSFSFIAITLIMRRYHSSVERWEFGKLSALQEAALAVEGGYRYYYMGKSKHCVTLCALSCSLIACIQAFIYIHVSRCATKAHTSHHISSVSPKYRQSIRLLSLLQTRNHMHGILWTKTCSLASPPEITSPSRKKDAWASRPRPPQPKSVKRKSKLSPT